MRLHIILKFILICIVALYTMYRKPVIHFKVDLQQKSFL